MFRRKQPEAQALATEIANMFSGLPVRLTRHEASWSIGVGDRLVINTLSWRLIGAESIVVTDEDDGHQFGLPAPVDAEAKANEALSGNRVSGVKVDSKTGDLSIEFGVALTLQLVTTSAGYEMWQIYRDGEFFAAGANGGLL